MVKFAVIDELKHDIFEEIFETLEEAIAKADSQWGHLTTHDKKGRVSFCVAEVTVDEDGLIDYEAGYNPIKEYTEQ